MSTLRIIHEKSVSGNVQDCKMCPVFTTSGFLMVNHNHVRRHHSASHHFNCENSYIEMYRCKDCNFQAELIVVFKQHQHKHHNIKNELGKIVVNSYFNRRYVCEKCGFKTHSPMKGLQHSTTCSGNERNHPTTNSVKNGEKNISTWYKCNICEHKDKVLFKKHKTLNHLKMKRKCDFKKHTSERHSNEHNIALNFHADPIVIKYENFSQLNLDEKLEIKKNGRPTPELNLKCASKSRGKSYVRRFNVNIYSKYRWMCGCQVKNRLFCFTCVLFGGDSNWTSSGVNDLVHLNGKAKQHENSKQHLTNEMQFTLLGKTNIQEQLNSAYWRNIATHNENVAKNRFILSKIIDAIKFCGAFEVAFRGHDESGNSDIFQGLINYAAELDKTLKKHIETAPVFKGTSKEIQNDLLDCIFEVYREEVSSEINNANFLGVIADETSDISTQLQTLILFRYVKDGKPVERFWGFFTNSEQTSDALASLILTELEPLVGKNPNKLIAQSYGGGAMMSARQGGVQAKIKEKYALAHFVHCWAHNLNLILAQAASRNTHVRLFFSNLSDIPAFFSDSSQGTDAFLKKIVDLKTSTCAPTFGNFKSRTVNVVYEYREELIECMEEIEESPRINNTTKNQASAIRRMLQEKSFVFWLTLFHHVMPHVDVLFDEFQKRMIDSAEINKCLKNFKENITNIRNQKMRGIMEHANSMEVMEAKRRKLNEDNWKSSAIEVCDVVIKVAEDRFQYTDQLNASNLFICEKFEWYNLMFPEDYFTQTIKSYPVLQKQRLKIELGVLYSSSECRNFSSCATLLNCLVDNDLQEVFQETIKLLEILVTMPMTTVEAERNFSKLERIKTFLTSTMCRDRLNALACLSIEQKFIRSISNFNEKIIDKFARRKNRRIDLV